VNGDEGVGTPDGKILVPRVILLQGYDRVPRRHVRYSRVNIFARDSYTCQYCGGKPHRSKLNLDHVIPRSLGGRTTWENVVCSCIDCNRRKGGRTPRSAAAPRPAACEAELDADAHAHRRKDSLRRVEAVPAHCGAGAGGGSRRIVDTPSQRRGAQAKAGG
jgi:5-methylcytosine-specific restriction endonuclease McrA